MTSPGELPFRSQPRWFGAGLPAGTDKSRRGAWGFNPDCRHESPAPGACVRSRLRSHARRLRRAPLSAGRLVRLATGSEERRLAGSVVGVFKTLDEAIEWVTS
jgi:hypothetical protein